MSQYDVDTRTNKLRLFFRNSLHNGPGNFFGYEYHTEIIEIDEDGEIIHAEDYPLEVCGGEWIKADGSLRILFRTSYSDYNACIAGWKCHSYNVLLETKDGELFGGEWISGAGLIGQRKRDE